MIQADEAHRASVAWGVSETDQGTRPMYDPVPVHAAKSIGMEYGKDAVVIVAIDREHNKSHYTNWGNEPSDKVLAAHVSDVICHHLAQLGGQEDLPREVFEDFRQVEAAVSRKQVELLTDAARRAVQTLEALWDMTGPEAPVRIAIDSTLQDLRMAIAWKPEHERAKD